MKSFQNADLIDKMSLKSSFGSFYGDCPSSTASYEAFYNAAIRSPIGFIADICVLIRINDKTVAYPKDFAIWTGHFVHRYSPVLLG
jgi:hypothetical protein